MTARAVCATALLFAAAVSAIFPLAAVAAAFGPLDVDGPRVVDATGREIVLRGVNVGEKSPAHGYVGWHGPEDFQRLRAWGYTAVRFLIFWDGIEPEPGRYDEDYLARVDERIAWANDAGIYVILDMHQDLFSPAIPGGNGMPGWAVLSTNLPHTNIPGLWSSAYLVSPRVRRAFDLFWANAPGPDGTGIQDRFAMAWAQVAARHAGNPGVAGFDVLNEPYAGSLISRGIWDIWRALPDILRGARLPGPGESWTEGPSPGAPPEWILEAMDDPARFTAFVDAIGPTQEIFETTQVQPMYQRVADAIRAVNTDALIFIAPGPFANFGARSWIAPVRGADGAPDPRQALLPHAYDLVTDTAAAHRPSANRLGIIYGRMADHVRETGLPAAIGEWGAFYGSSRAMDAAALMVAEMGRAAMGDFYWDYRQGLQETAYFPMLCRPTAWAVAGRLTGFETDWAARRFAVSWEAAPEVGAPTEIFAPALWYADAPRAGADPGTPAPEVAPVAGGWLVRVPGGGAGARRLVLQAAEAAKELP